MGFSLGSPFSSDSEVTNRTETQNAGFSEIRGPALALHGTGNLLEFTDAGAIEAGREVALAGLEQVELAGQRTSRTVGRAVEAVSESAREETENLVGDMKTVAVYAIVGYLAAVVIRQWWG